MAKYNGDGKSHPQSMRRDKLHTRWGALKSERATWDAHWQEISSYLLPRSGRFFVQDRNRGQRRHNNILDNTGTRALRVLGAGMMAGATSPARPWFRLTTPDPDMAKSKQVSIWLDQVTTRMQMVFQKSNTYRALHQIYEEIGAFGTGANIILPDYDNVIHNYTLTTGEFAIQTDYRGHVCTLYREFDKTIGEVVKEFGYENVSTSVKNLYDRGTLDSYVTLIHAIEPREDRDINKRDSMNMPWKSCYFELNADNDKKYLRESGFEEFPAVCPRWATIGGDVYGNSPGMEALGDIKQLQHEQLRKAQGIDYMTRPPLQVPTSMKNREVDMLPSGITYVDAASPQQGIRSAFEVRLDLNHLLMDIQDVRERVRGAFYADLFLMLANATDTRMTATEVAERHEEKLLMLGPVLERLQTELLSPLIDITFTTMLRAEMIPPPPPELEGVDLSVEFVSMLAQAQRAVGTNSMDRYVANLGQVATMKPDVLDNFDADVWAQEYGDMLGVDPSLIVASDKVALVREQRAKAQQMQQMAQMQAQQAKTGSDMAKIAETDPEKMTNVIDMFSGYNSP